MRPWCNVGAGVIDIGHHAVDCRVRVGPVLALFVPSRRPDVAVSPGGGAHLRSAVGWAMTALGCGFRGGRLVLVSEPGGDPWRECLCAVMAVDDAIAGGHRGAGVIGTGLVDRVLREPRHLATAVGLDLASH